MMLKSSAAAAAALAILAFGAPVPAFADDPETISGVAKAIDADMVMIDKTRIVLWGVDAPDRNQTCLLSNQEIECYTPAADALAALIAPGPLTCTLTGKPDPFGRRFGVCKIGDLDVGAELIRQGWAAAYLDQTDIYKPMQDEAIAAKVGLRAEGMKFENPWTFRFKHHAGTR
jgi:endonuclease YncB( thermonuclease family)